MRSLHNWAELAWLLWPFLFEAFTLLGDSAKHSVLLSPKQFHLLGEVLASLLVYQAHKGPLLVELTNFHVTLKEKKKLLKLCSDGVTVKKEDKGGRVRVLGT